MLTNRTKIAAKAATRAATISTIFHPLLFFSI